MIQITQQGSFMNSLNIKRVLLSTAAAPVLKYRNTGGIIQYGDRNDFYAYLIDLYLNSSKHNAIVNGKVQQIAGIVEGLSDDVNEIRTKCIKDYVLFGGFAIKVFRTLDGSISRIEYLPYHTIRKIEDIDSVAISKEWVKRSGVFKYSRNTSAKYIELPIYNRDDVQPVSVYLCENIDYTDVYPVPEYIGGLQYIEMDYRVANFWNNTISRGFAASHIINVYSAGLTEEEKDIIDAQIQEMFAGDDNAGSYVLNFVRKEGEGTNIQTIQQPNLDSLYNLLNQAITQEIFISHRVTSPMLFGVRTEGQLGGRNELLDAQNLFNAIYVRPMRSHIDRSIQALLGIQYEVRDNAIITQDVTQLKGILTIDEIREAFGYKPLSGEQKIDIEQKKNEALNKLKQVKTRAHLDIKYSADLDVNDVGANNEMMVLLSNRYGVLSEKDVQILKWILRDNTIDNRLLANIVGISIATLKRAIAVLQEEGYLDENRMLTEKAINELAKVDRGDAFVTSVRYSYEWAYGFSNKDKKNSRDFCKYLMDESERRKMSGELWTREDIENISAEVGWDVWTMRGGWYRVPGTEVSIPHCRHTWKQHITIEKAK